MDAMDMEAAPEDQDQEKRKYFIWAICLVLPSIWHECDSISNVEMLTQAQIQVEYETAICV